MGTRSVLLVLSLAALAACAACGFSGAGSGGSSSGLDGAAPSLDGGDADAAPPPLLDGGSDSTVTPVDPGFDSSMCTTVIDDAFASPPGNWAALDDATIGPGRAQLTTQDNTAQSGAIWWKSPLSFGARLTVTVDIALTLSGSEGDGIAVGWVPTTTAYVIGAQGQNYGICSSGMAGLGAAFDTRDNQLAILSSFSGVCGTDSVVTFDALLTAKRFTLEITPTTLTLTTDNGGMVTRTQSSSPTGQLGITASTGAKRSGHAITHVKVVSCP